MDWIRKVLSSKTLNINGAIVAIIALLAALGVEIPPELSATIVAIVMGVVNILLRFLTTEPISEK